MRIESLTDEQIARLLAVRVNPRAAVLVDLLLLEGLGLGEILALDHEHIARSAAGDRQALSVELIRHGRPRSIELHVDTASAIAVLRRSSGGRGPLLVAAQPAGVGQRITRFGADYLIKQSAQAAGLPAAVSANVLRRSHALAAQRRGVHVLDTRDRMGHQDVRTTYRHLGGP
jgi:integrase